MKGSIILFFIFLTACHFALAAESNYGPRLERFSHYLCSGESPLGAKIGNYVGLMTSLQKKCDDETDKMIVDSQTGGTFPSTQAEYEYFQIGLVLKACTFPSAEYFTATWGARRSYCYKLADEEIFGHDGKFAECLTETFQTYNKNHHTHFTPALINVALIDSMNIRIQEVYSQVANCYEKKFSDEFSEKKATWRMERTSASQTVPTVRIN